MLNILFEDHSWRRFRPLAWSLPTYEIRCGMFNLRERMELIAPAAEGVLLCRDLLAPLHTAPNWRCPHELPAGRMLWLSGRLAPRPALLTRLHDLRGEDWALADDHGLLAASLPPAAAADLFAVWQRWQQQGWSTATFPIPDTVASMPTPDLVLSGGEMDLGWVWDIVPQTAGAIEADLELVGSNRLYERHPFGLHTPKPGSWTLAGSLRRVEPNLTGPEGVIVTGGGGLYLGSGGQDLAVGTHCDTAAGPIILDSGVRIMPHVYLAGPLYLGRDTIVKAGARICGESSFGVGNRLAGEIGESTFGDFTNKQHDGFIGHAVLGSWVNLGAVTTCSDLKNNYGSVRVDLGDGVQDTGQRFVGLLMGDHAKTAIGTLFNTGSTVGFASNIFGAEMPPKHVANFSWGGQPDAPVYDADRAAATATVVCGRRGCVFGEAHHRLLRFLHNELAHTG